MWKNCLYGYIYLIKIYKIFIVLIIGTFYLNKCLWFFFHLKLYNKYSINLKDNNTQLTWNNNNNN